MLLNCTEFGYKETVTGKEQWRNRGIREFVNNILGCGRNNLEVISGAEYASNIILECEGESGIDTGKTNVIVYSTHSYWDKDLRLYMCVAIEVII